MIPSAFISPLIRRELLQAPCPMSPFGHFVYKRTYARYLPSEKRREEWAETVLRTVDYSFSLVYRHLQHTKGDVTANAQLPALIKEADQLARNLFHLRQFPSGRSLWIAGTAIAEEHPLANFNCSFMVIRSLESFCDMFYLLMLGSGTGFRTLPDDVAQLPHLRSSVRFLPLPYRPLPPEKRQDHTLVLRPSVHTARIVVGDSKEGWVQSLREYWTLLSDPAFEDVTTIEMDCSHVRPKGERLKRFGGTASGHEGLVQMFQKIHRILSEAEGRIRPIVALDIGNIIAENVVSGGVRRSSQINLAAADEQEIEFAKTHLWSLNQQGEFAVSEAIAHRQNSNNSIFYEEKPTREQLRANLKNMRYTGERGFVNVAAARKRCDGFEGLNPCAEILLRDQQVCNLSTVNVMGFVRGAFLQRSSLFEAIRLAVRIGIRMNLPTLELPEWDAQQKRDNLTGVSLTGWFDMVDSLSLSTTKQIQLLRQLKYHAHDEAHAYSRYLGVNSPKLITTIKPEGTLSQLAGVSSGVHRAHSPFFLRRVRISAQDPLLHLLRHSGFRAVPDSNQTAENAHTFVVEFPMRSPVKTTKHDVSAIEQLETYKMFQNYYTDHNTSITVTVRDHEWKDVEEWLWHHWDDVVAVSFFPLYDAVSPLLPYQTISEETYHRAVHNLPLIDYTQLSHFEANETVAPLDTECEGGQCPVR